MPWNPDGTRKKSSLYKKSSGFKMKGYSYPGTSPVKNEELDNLKKVVPNEEVFSELPENQKKDFLAAWKKHGGKTIQVKEKKKESVLKNYKKGYYGA